MAGDDFRNLLSKLSLVITRYRVGEHSNNMPKLHFVEAHDLKQRILGFL